MEHGDLAPIEATLITTERSRHDLVRDTAYLTGYAFAMALVLAPFAVWAVMLLIPLVADLFGATIAPGYWRCAVIYLLSLVVRLCWPRR